MRRLLLVAMMLLPVRAAGAPDAMIYDPWLERFHVGEFRSPQDVTFAGGWPEGLLEALALDPGWRLGAERFFAGETLPVDAAGSTWRLAYPALGEPETVASFYRQARHQWEALRRAADGVAAAEPADPPGPWTSALRQLQASRLWSAGRYAAAAGVVEGLLADAADLGLSPSQNFVWSLRAEMLAARAEVASPPPALRLWRYLATLGPYDTRSGWAVWCAVQRDRERPPLPAGSADREAGVMLATAGQLWLSAAELRDAGFPTAVEAGLGALLLPVAELPAHFRRWPEPPQDGLFQGYWLRGQRRWQGGADAVARLAALPDLLDGHRLDLWRRASEGYLLRGAWTAGLSALEQGLRLMDSDASTAMKDRLRIWVAQALALAAAKQRTGDAARLMALAREHLTPQQMQALHSDASPVLPGADRPPPPADLRARSEALVLWGEAPAIDAAPARELPSAESWRHRLWASWARWGLALLADEAAATAACQAYRSELDAVLAADEPDQRHAIAVATAAAWLRGAPAVGPLLGWAMARDIERLSAGAALPHATPLPGLRPPAEIHGPARHLHDHALLGAALALGDDRGVLAMAVRLPAAGVAAADRWPFWYPLPSDPAIRAALGASAMAPELLLAIARNESLFEAAVRSRAGALGYMQIMPLHYASPAAAPSPRHWRHPAASLGVGDRILAAAVRRHGGDPYRSVAAYNAGSAAVERWDEQLGGGADGRLYRAWISYPETRGYTLNVLRDREVYRHLLSATP